MPRVTFEKIEYVFDFQYGVANHTGNPKKDRDYTICTIKVGAYGTRDDEKTLVGNSLVLRSPKDTPNRRVARKVSLERALEKAGVHVPLDVRPLLWNQIRV